MADLGLESFGYGNVTGAGQIMNNYRTQADQHDLSTQAVNQAKLQQILDQLKISDKQTDNQASDIYGKSFLDQLSGTPPALPGSQAIDPSMAPAPSPGMSSAPSMPVSRMPMAAPQGPPSDPGIAAGGGSFAPPAPPASGPPPQQQMQAPPPQQQPPMPPQMPTQTMGGMPNLTWQQIATSIKRQAPNASGQVIAGVIDKYSGLMTTQAKADWERQKYALELRQADQRDRMMDIRGTNTGLGIANNQVRQDTNFGNQIVPTPAAPGMMGSGRPMGNGQPMAQPPMTAGSGSDIQLPAGALSTVANAAAPTGGMSQAPSVVPTARVQAQNAMAKDSAKTVAANDRIRPQQLQTEDSLNHLMTLMSSPDFSTGAGADTRVNVANILATMTGDPTMVQKVVTGQMDQKAIADVLTNQIASFGSGNRSLGTDRMKGYIEQAKPSMTNQPEANKSVISAQLAQLQRTMLYQDYYKASLQKDGLYTPQANASFERAARQFPLFKTEPNGTITFQPQNAGPFQRSLETVAGPGFSAIGDPSDTPTSASAAAAPKPGTVMQGYTFKGGDPSDQKNWAPVGGQ